jgi:hypothetical protein
MEPSNKMYLEPHPDLYKETKEKVIDERSMELTRVSASAKEGRIRGVSSLYSK